MLIAVPAEPRIASVFDGRPSMETVREGDSKPDAGHKERALRGL